MSLYTTGPVSPTPKSYCIYNMLKNGSTKSVVEGLSHSHDNYSEVVECLKARFNCPSLIHHTHVRMISEAPVLKDGTGKELRHLHDTAQQHIHALRPWAMSLLVHSSPPYWSSSWTRTQCLSGNGIVKSQQMFLTSPNFCSS